jgi:hypothetical protein
MDKGAAVALAAVVGGLVATQAPLNSQLGRTVGGLHASVVALADHRREARGRRSARGRDVARHP